MERTAKKREHSQTTKLFLKKTLDIPSHHFLFFIFKPLKPQNLSRNCYIKINKTFPKAFLFFQKGNESISIAFSLTISPTAIYVKTLRNEVTSAIKFTFSHFLHTQSFVPCGSRKRNLFSFPRWAYETFLISIFFPPSVHPSHEIHNEQ